MSAMSGEQKREGPAGASRGGSERAGPAIGFRALRDVELDAPNARSLELASRRAAGDPSWRRRKIAEAREVLALSQIAPPDRLRVEWLDLRDDLCAFLCMRVPVPCLPAGAADIVIARKALLGLRYPREAVRVPFPGAEFVQILEPQDVWHPSVSRPYQSCCLGTRLPAGVRLRSLLLMTYVALAMQAVQVDELDGAGVFNLEAARWWQANLARAPLSATSFLAPDAPAAAATGGRP